MSGLSVKFRAIDEISAKFDQMANAGENVLAVFDRINSAAETALSSITTHTDSVRNAMERTARSSSALSEALGGFGNAADASEDLVEQTRSISDAQEDLEEQIRNVSNAQEELSEQSSGTSNAEGDLADQTRRIEDILNDLTDTIDNTSDSMGGLGDETEETGEQSESFGQQSTDAINMLANVLTTAGIVEMLNNIANAFSECSDKAAEYETSVAQITTVADASILSAGKLADQINDTSMKMAQNVNELADSSYNAISAGVDTAQAVSTVADSTKLSVAGFTSVSSSLGVLTTALNAYQLESGELTQISDSLVMSQNLGVLTIDQLGSSMGKAISTASAYSVNLYNLESGYISLTKAGIGVDESTTYLSSMFNELGSSSSNVAKILKEDTGQTFGQLMNAGYDLADVLEILYDSVGQNSEALMNLWGSAEAGKAGNALISQGLETFRSNLESVTYATGATEKAYRTMTATTEYATQRMGNSFDNLQIAIGDDLNPTVAALKNGIADMTDEFTKFINDHPAATAAIAAVTVAVGVFTVAVTAFALVTCPTVVTAVKAVTAAMMANPIFLAITAVVAITAAVVAFVQVLMTQETEYERWTSSTRKQYDELQNLNAEYEEACDRYGETSKEASRLKYEMDNLNAEFEQNKKTVEEFVAECDAMIESNNKLLNGYNENMAAIRENETGTFALIQRLEDLANANDRTVASEEQMRAIIEQLNKDLPDLSLSYDDVTKSTESMVDAMRKAAEQQAVDERKAEQQRAYVELLKERANLEDKIAEAQANLNLEREAYGMFYDDTLNEGLGGYRNDNYLLNEESLVADWWTDLDDYNDALSELQQTYDETQAEIEKIEDSFGNAAIAAQEAQAEMSATEAVALSIDIVKDKLEEVCTVYDEVYQAAYSSISSQIGLFDTMKTECEQSVSEMQAAMESQLDYLNTYSENLRKASEYGLNDSMISTLSDGSAESAGQLDAIIAKIEQLGGTTEGMSSDAQEFINSFNDSFSKVEEAKETWANNVAAIETDFSDSMDGIQADMKSAIENMNMADEAATAAQATMDAYIQSIKNKTGEVHSAVKALSWTNENMSSLPVAAHADGGIFDTPHYGVFAEAGPESFIPINNSEDSLNIWKQTGQMIGAFGNEKSENEGFYVAPAEERGDERNGERTVTLKIEGSGDMCIGSNMSKEDVVNVLIDNVKDALMNIIYQEILEEGDYAYDF